MVEFVVGSHIRRLESVKTKNGSLVEKLSHLGVKVKHTCRKGYVVKVLRF